ncbi:PKD domain-containing protein [Pleionea mediterranea]|uniref:YD repeat-containing protein n=1 Tax=Pleionea mediterranea TaxID=523701 RepID=A0A316FVY5_9GAMM|nr:PKD domain-containing protein [Pleionea mediterranea]PWK52944.1 YD repeat-containing protein [Pleionea mediterranea]
MNLLNRSLYLIACLFSITVLAEGDSNDPDFYSMPGVNKARAYDADGNVLVDAFGGTLGVHYTDMVVPGTGPDIVINRSFNSATSRWENSTKNFVGSRWDIHFGRLGGGDSRYFCGTNDLPVIDDRTVFILPDGSSQTILSDPLIFLDGDKDGEYDPENSDDYKPHFVTNDLWSVVCNNGQLVITDSSGLSYVIGNYEYDWRVIQIFDRYNNYININYSGSAYNLKVSSITASDGREVSFSYSDDKLTEISYLGQTVSYEVSGKDSNQRLDRVERPDGSDFTYTYYDNDPLSGYIKEIKNPLGKVTSFEYEHLKFTKKDYYVVAKKCVEANCWTYSYTRGELEGDETYADYDTTTITGPDGIKTYWHHGLFSPIITSGYGTNPWSVGLLKKYSHSLNGEILEEFTQKWVPFTLNPHPRVYSEPNTQYTLRDLHYNVPKLKQKTTNRNGQTFIYEVVEFNNAGSPVVTKSEGSKTIYNEVQYANLKGESWGWILNLPYKESVSLSNSSFKLVNQYFYNAQGSVSSKVSKGQQTFYEYYNDGNLKAEIDGVGNRIDYRNYKRGIAKVVSYPGGSKFGTYTKRDVDDYGRVTKEINQKGVATSYSYDSMNRVREVNHPLSETVTVDYYDNGRRVEYQKGNVKQINNFNVYGDIETKITIDTLSQKNFAQHFRYDDLQRLRFKSFVNSTTDGTTYSYDGYNRVTHQQTTGSNAIVTDYVSPSEKQVTDPEQNVTRYFYDTFSPSEKYISKVEAPESVIIEITRDELGQPLIIKQNDIVREYGYNENWNLNYYKEPEVDGHLSYVYDLAGRKKEDWHYLNGKTYKTFYSYDELGRLTEIEYPEYYSVSGHGMIYDMPEECTNGLELVCNHTSYKVTDSYEYDRVGNVTKGKRNYEQIRVTVAPYAGVYPSESYNHWLMEYDNENRLVSEKFYNGTPGIFEFSYEYNNLNHLTSTTYPSGYKVNYEPDAFGRASKVGDLVSGIEYFDSGALKKMTYANGQITEFNLNERLLPESLTVGNGLDEFVEFNYLYDFNGNIESIEDGINPNKSHYLTYDGLDRLRSAEGIWGAGSYDYDTLGNIKSKSIGSKIFDYEYDDNNRLSSFNNQEYLYDIKGRVISDSNNEYFYDFSNNLIQAKALNEGGFYTYRYDINNRMYSKKYSTGEKDTFAYNNSGKLMYEVLKEGDLKRSHIYLGSKLVAYHDEVIECSDDLDNDGMGHCYERENNLNPNYDDASGDRDNDGLTNLEEFNLGSSSSSADTDNDGIHDLYEHQYGLNILDNDASLDNDDDGFTNLEEFLQNTDPNQFDKLSVPRQFGATGDKSFIRLSWNKVPFATGYNLYWSDQTFSDVSEANLITLSNENYKHQIGSPGQKIFYRVVAKKDEKLSDISELITGYTGDLEWQLLPEISGVGDIHADNSGSVMFIGSSSRLDRSEAVYFKSGSVNPEEYTLFNFGSDFGKKSVMADNGSVAFALVNQSTDSIWVAVFNAKQQSWSVKKLKNADSGMEIQSYIELVASPNGSFVLSWVEDRHTKSERWAAWWSEKTGWSTPKSLAIYKDPNGPYQDYSAQKAGLAINDNLDVAIIWRLDKKENHNSVGLETHLFLRSKELGVQNYKLGDSYYQSELAVGLNNDGNGIVSWHQRGSSINTVEVARFNTDGTLLPSETVLEGGVENIEIPYGNTDGKLLFIGDEKLGAYKRQDNGDWYLDGILEQNLASKVRKLADNTYRMITYSRGQNYYDINNYEVNDYVDGNFDTVTAYEKGNIIRQAGFTVTGSAIRYDVINDSSVYRLSNRLRGENQHPIAVADVSVEYRESKSPLATLSGDQSYDIDGVIAKYQWRQIEGPNADISKPNNRITSVRLPNVMSGSFEFELSITDDRGATAVERVSLEINNPHGDPEANAGAYQRVGENTIVQLSGDGSIAASQNPIIRYKWTQVSGPNITLDDNSSSNITFTSPEVTETTHFVFELEVAGENDAIDTDRVVITVVDYQPPVANAGDDQTVDAGDRVVLDFSNSYDPDGGSINMNISTISGGYVQLEQGSQSGTLEFTAPDVSSDTTYVFRLNITDDEGDTATDDVAITVRAPIVAEKPVANAGSNQTFDEGTTVTLDASASAAPEGESITGYSWTQLAGTVVTLNDSTSVAPQFTAPDVGETTQLQFQLTITASNGETNQSTVIITVTDTSGNLPPVANAGDDQTVNEGDNVILDARASNDPDGNSLNLSWRVVSGGNVNLQQGPEQGTLQFTAPSVGIDSDYVFEVTVTDAAGASSSDQVTITVLNTDAPPPTGQCELDFDGNGIVESKDFHSNNYEGIYYAVYIYLNYPNSYNSYFPNTPEEKLDWNGDGNITIEEVYTGTISEQTKETYQTQHYMYMNDKNTYANWYPNSGCAL